MSGARCLGPCVVVDRRVGFGRPIIAGRGIKTSVIADRYAGGESVEDIAYDYRITRDEVLAAVCFEAGRAWADGGRKEWNRDG